jgi:crotonobetainyl-CoA:carnitine CoA-transferase CaiB-like acyl-CoA transferase
VPGERELERSTARWEPQRAWAVSILSLGLLLFAWPFVRTPPLAIGASYLHLLGSWLVVVGALAAMARALRRRGTGRGARRG